MLFFEKENIFMCLAVTKFILRKINSGVWFIQTFLQKMLYIPNFSYTSSTVNKRIINQFHTHSQKKQNPAKKFIKSGQIQITRRRRRWDRAVKVRSSGGEIGAIVRRAARSTIAIAPLVGRLHRSLIAPLVGRSRSSIRPLIGTVRSSDERCDRRSVLSDLGSIFSLSPIWALSTLSLSLFPEMNWSENKGAKSFPDQRSNCWPTGNDFLENEIFRCCQTRGFGGKWFQEIIFPQNKRTLA